MFPLWADRRLSDGRGDGPRCIYDKRTTVSRFHRTARLNAGCHRKTRCYIPNRHKAFRRTDGTNPRPLLLAYTCRPTRIYATVARAWKTVRRQLMNILRRSRPPPSLLLHLLRPRQSSRGVSVAGLLGQCWSFMRRWRRRRRLVCIPQDGNVSGKQKNRSHLAPEKEHNYEPRRTSYNVKATYTSLSRIRGGLAFKPGKSVREYCTAR